MTEHRLEQSVQCFLAEYCVFAEDEPLGLSTEGNGKSC